MALIDALSDWWVHPVQVRRWTQPDADGNVLDAAVTVTGFYSDATRYAPNGEVTASGRFAFPTSTPYIPVQSKVTLPATFGGRTVTVTQTEVADGGGLPTPDHQVIYLL